MQAGQRVETPDGPGVVIDVTLTAVEPWATVEVDGIADEYAIADLRTSLPAIDRKAALRGFCE